MPPWWECLLPVTSRHKHKNHPGGNIKTRNEFMPKTSKMQPKGRLVASLSRSRRQAFMYCPVLTRISLRISFFASKCCRTFPVSLVVDLYIGLYRYTLSFWRICTTKSLVNSFILIPLITIKCLGHLHFPPCSWVAPPRTARDSSFPGTRRPLWPHPDGVPPTGERRTAEARSCRRRPCRNGWRA